MAIGTLSIGCASHIAYRDYAEAHVADLFEGTMVVNVTDWMSAIVEVGG